MPLSSSVAGRQHVSRLQGASDSGMFYVDSSVCGRFFFSSRRRHTRCSRDWSSDVCSSDLFALLLGVALRDWIPGLRRSEEPVHDQFPPDALAGYVPEDSGAVLTLNLRPLLE